ncbi:MAG TPA: DUF6011 domain-containing protein [Glaciihabitans sp.]|jgi:hypothetical protein|nr:DUF6011 domain-containing protein [Glaciihabitans sp.]
MASKIQKLYIDMVPQGNYAARLEEGRPLQFFRVDRPTFGNFEGFTKVQRRGADMLSMLYLVGRDGTLRIYDDRYADEFLTVIADLTYASVLYGQELGKCCRCNISLTDERSRYYGIGPECAKHWSSLIEYVHEQKGIPKHCESYEV